MADSPLQRSRGQAERRGMPPQIPRLTREQFQLRLKKHSHQFGVELLPTGKRNCTKKQPSTTKRSDLTASCVVAPTAIHAIALYPFPRCAVYYHHAFAMPITPTLQSSGRVEKFDAVGMFRS